MVEDSLQTLYSDMVKWRRHFHQHPELSFQEYETSKMIAELLQSWGLEVRQSGTGTGIAATLKGALPGKVIALRADIDALPISDEKNCEYASKVPGVMHACGHDAHTAELLAVARYYSLHRDVMVGTRVFLFQPAEELLPGGAADMIQDGALDGVDAIYGVHLWSQIPYGAVMTRAGALMASPDEFELEIIGKGGHGGLPHQSADAIVTGAAVVQALQTIVSRNVNPLDAAVLSVGYFQAGAAKNVIAERCKLGGTIRSLTPDVRKRMRKRLEEIIDHVCKMHGTQYNLRFVEGYPALVNDATEAQRVLSVAARVLPECRTSECEPVMAGEDFAYYLQEKPGCFIFVGAGREDGSSPPHHHPLFDIDERSMLVAARLLIAVADDAAASDFSGEK